MRRKIFLPAHVFSMHERVMGKKPSPSISLRWPSFKKPLWGDIISCKNNYTTVFEKHPTKFFCAKKIYIFGQFWNKNSHKVLCNFSAKIKTFKISAKKPFLVQKLKLLILRIFTFFPFGGVSCSEKKAIHLGKLESCLKVDICVPEGNPSSSWSGRNSDLMCQVAQKEA